MKLEIAVIIAERAAEQRQRDEAQGSSARSAGDAIKAFSEAAAATGGRPAGLRDLLYANLARQGDERADEDAEAEAQIRGLLGDRYTPFAYDDDEE